jgi:hypothetical protein
MKSSIFLNFCSFGQNGGPNNSMNRLYISSLFLKKIRDFPTKSGVAEKRPSAGGVRSPSAPCARKFITRRGSRHYILANKQINSAARASFGLRCLRAGGAGCGGGGLLALFTHPCVKWSSSSSSALHSGRFNLGALGYWFRSSLK